MKIKNNKLTKNKLIKLQIIKSKIYKNTVKKKIETSKVKLYLKKIAYIIYEYHIKNKTILFLNFPFLKFKNNISLKTNIRHIFISKKNLLNESIDQILKNNLSTLKKNFDLVVLFNPINLKVYSFNIPIIMITDKIFITKNPILNQSYKLFGYNEFIEKQINNNFILSILNVILKKPTNTKTRKYDKLKRVKTPFKNYKRYSFGNNRT